MSYEYPWMLCYLDERYNKIIRRQGLTHFVKDFLDFTRKKKKKKLRSMCSATTFASS